MNRTILPHHVPFLHIDVRELRIRHSHSPVVAFSRYPNYRYFFAHIEPLRHKEEIARSREAPLPCFACMMPFTGDKQNAMKEQNCSHAWIGKTIVARNQHGCRLASRSKRITWVKSINTLDLIRRPVTQVDGVTLRSRRRHPRVGEFGRHHTQRQTCASISNYLKKTFKKDLFTHI